MAALDGERADAPVRRIRLPRAQRMGDILAAARRVFARRGYAAASIAEIATEAGVAEGTIYKFFDSKRHLLVRVIESWYDSMVAEFDRHLPGVTGARNRIRFIIWRHIVSLQENKDLARLCLNEARNGVDYYQSELRDLNRRYTHVFLEACREGMANGELRADLPVTLVRDLVFGGLEHHLSPALSGKAELAPELTADLIMEIVFGGIADRAHKAAQPGLDVLQRLEDVAARLEGRLQPRATKRSPQR